LLGSIVQIALQSPALGVAGIHDPGAGGLQVGQLCAGLGMKSLVVQDKAGRLADLAAEVAVVQQFRAVGQECHRLCAAHHGGHRLPIVRRRGSTRGVDPHPVVQPVHHPQGWISQGTREQATQATDRRRAGNVDDHPVPSATSTNIEPEMAQKIRLVVSATR